jgi:hypothetical protein
MEQSIRTGSPFENPEPITESKRTKLLVSCLAGIHGISSRTIRNWFERTQLGIWQFIPMFPQRFGPAAKVAGRQLEALFSEEYVVHAWKMWTSPSEYGDISVGASTHNPLPIIPHVLQ